MQKYLLNPKKEGEHAVLMHVSAKFPYLKDHDVGVPLFGTSMSVEAMAESYQCRTGCMPTVFEDIRAGKDCLIPDESILSCAVKKETDGYICELNHENDPIFRCRISNALWDENPADAEMIPEHFSIRAEQIYQKFFHGPSFQVVEKACLQGDKMIAYLNPSLPPLYNDDTAKAVIPVQILELCMQTSGLLDMALDSHMSVPKGIRRLEILRYQAATNIYAAAKRTPCGTDITAYDSQKRMLLRVTGYQTKPMPYD